MSNTEESIVFQDDNSKCLHLPNDKTEINELINTISKNQNAEKLCRQIALPPYQVFGGIRIEHTPEKQFYFSLTYKDGAKIVADLTYTVQPEVPNTGITGLHVKPDYQKKGLGKKILANIIVQCQDLCIPRIAVLASDDVGGYAWGKFGFKQNAIFNGRILASMNQRFMYLKPQLQAEQIEKVEKILNKSESDFTPEDFWELIDQEINVNPSESKRLRFILPIDPSESMPLGLALTAGISWPGIFDVQPDSASMKRFNENKQDLVQTPKSEGLQL